MRTGAGRGEEGEKGLCGNPKRREAGAEPDRPRLSAAYLATPPGGGALLRAGGWERLGRDVQHPGPRPGPCLGPAAGPDRSAGPLRGYTSRAGSEAGQRPSPRPTSGVARGEARHDAARRVAEGGANVTDRELAGEGTRNPGIVRMLR